MERMAAEIVATAREFNVDVLLDMHESWAFFAEYAPGSGTGALGQTITAGVGPRQATLAQEIADRVNPMISARETMLVRNGNAFQRPTTTPTSSQTNRGRSSLSIGGHVTGLTPILVEMGQENQAQDRRVHLHLTVAEALLHILGVLN
jgi:hypothetical protein